MIGSSMLRVSLLLLVVGPVGGVAMGVAHDFQLTAAHAHLNLLGGVLTFLFGLYYPARSTPRRRAPCEAAGLTPHHRRDPVSDRHRRGHVEGHELVIVPIVGSLIVLPAVILFAAIVFQTSKAEQSGAAVTFSGPSVA